MGLKSIINSAIACLAIVSFSSVHAAIVTVDSTQNIEVSFTLSDPLPTADVLYVTIANTGNTTDSLTATLYDGELALGMTTSDPSAGFFSNFRPFQFYAFDGPFASEFGSDDTTGTGLHRLPIDFSSINDGSINFRLVFSSNFGSFDIDLDPPMGGASIISFEELTSVDSSNPLDGVLLNSLNTFEVPKVVPIPATVWLFGSGLLGIAGFLRKNKRGRREYFLTS